MGLLTVICILLKGCLGDFMTLLQFLGFSFISSLLKLSWYFYNEEQKEGTLQMLENEIFTILLEDQNKELAREMQELYIYLLEH